MSNQALWMDHTNKVITNLEFLASEYKTVELNFRAYMSNRSPDLLVNLIISKKNTDSLLHLINDLTSQNEYHHNIQQLRLDTIRNAIETKFKNMQLLQDTTSPIPADITLKDFLQNMGGSTTSNTAAIIKRIKEMESYEGYILQQRAD
ncbi:MAG: CHASE3 domain-containing protein, partial [Bacteroidetes bacterium]|nr:CHASE3 domain-containing protein [Bacteroidota bacterium]